MFDVFTYRCWYIDIETYSRIVVIIYEIFVLFQKDFGIYPFMKLEALSLCSQEPTV
jgi:hypothetical protein